MTKSFTYYMGNFIYTRDGLRYNFADGYTDGTTNGYHYYIRDHQGNNRVVAKYDGTIEQTMHYYPYGGTLTHSTEQGVQKYKYNGKEFICFIFIAILICGCSQRFTVNDSKEPYLIVNLENGYQMYFNKNVLLKYVTENPHLEKRDSDVIDTLRNMSSSYTMDIDYGILAYNKERFWHDFFIELAFEYGAKKMLINKEAILLDKKKRKRLDYYTVDTVYVMRYVGEAFSAFEVRTLDGKIIYDFKFGTVSDY